MIIAFQIVLLIVILFSAANATENEVSKEVREATLTVFVASISAFIASVVWL